MCCILDQFQTVDKQSHKHHEFCCYHEHFCESGSLETPLSMISEGFALCRDTPLPLAQILCQCKQLMDLLIFKCLLENQTPQLWLNLCCSQDTCRYWSMLFNPIMWKQNKIMQVHCLVWEYLCGCKRHIQ